jgi:hypothetical protein
VCAVHAGGFRRKGGDSQCVVVLVHKEGQAAGLECPWYVGRPSLGGTWRTLGVVRHARAMDFGLPLVAAFNRMRLQSVLIRVCPGRCGVLDWYE